MTIFRKIVLPNNKGKNQSTLLIFLISNRPRSDVHWVPADHCLLVLSQHTQNMPAHQTTW